MPDREVTLSAQVAGEVLAHNLEIGQQVTANQPILEIDPRIYEQRREQVQKQLAEGESELSRLKQEQANANRLLVKVKSDYETADQQYERRKSLQSRELLTPDELARSLLELRQYEEAVIRQENETNLAPLKIDQVEKRQATTETALALAQFDLDHTKILPPFSGTISEVLVEAGQYVRVGDPLLRITNTNAVEIPIPIKLSDYAKLSPLLQKGDFPRVQLATDVNAAPTWTGRLTRTAPKADRENRTIEIYVEVENGQQKTPLLAGTFLHARIEGPALANVFAIPRDALINNHVLIATDNADSPVVQKRIVPIETLQSLAIIDQGLAEGDQLILTNLDVLYRDPVELSSANPTKPPALMINQKHFLPEFLESQTQSLVTIIKCALPVLSPLPWGERARVRGTNGLIIVQLGLSPSSGGWPGSSEASPRNCRACGVASLHHSHLPNAPPVLSPLPRGRGLG